MYSIIFATDLQFQVIKVLINFDTYKAWDEANRMFDSGELEKAKIDSYDVITFNSVGGMNDWIFEQVSNGRNDK